MNELNQEHLLPITSEQVASIYHLAHAKILRSDEMDYQSEDCIAGLFENYDESFRAATFPIVNDLERYTGFISVALADPAEHGYSALISIGESEQEIDIERANEESGEVVHEVKTYAIQHQGFRLSMIKCVEMELKPNSMYSIELHGDHDQSKSLILQDEVGNLMALLS